MPIDISIPSDFIALFDAVIAIDHVFADHDPSFDGIEDCIYRLRMKLSGGELKAYGIIVSKGELLEIPIETWRMPYSRIFLDLRKPYQVKFANGSIVKNVFVIVKRDDLIDLFDVNNSLEGHFKNIELGNGDLHKHSTVSYDFLLKNASSRKHKLNKAKKKLSEADLRKWFINEYIPIYEGKIDTPNEQRAWKDSCAHFSDYSVPRDSFFLPFYRKFAPPEWKRIDKPKRKN